MSQVRRPILLSSLVAFCWVIFSIEARAEDFDSWRAGLATEAKEAGISAETIEATLLHIELLPNVVKLDRAQPEFITTFLDYYGKRVNARKIARGQELLFAYAPLLEDLEAQYGVPGALLIAFWGMETNFGSFKGNIDTFSTLTTLANDGRRATFFRKQLLDAMQLADDGHVVVGELQGSWAGAFGHMQFMPSTMRVYGMDGDGDRRIDLINSIEDALTSAANYLSQAGWRSKEPAMIEVQLPGDFAWQEATLKTKKPLKIWQAQGVELALNPVPEDIAISDSDPDKIAETQIRHHQEVTPGNQDNKTNIVNNTAANGTNIKRPVQRKWPMVDGLARVLLPQGWRGPAFMVFDNFDVIMEWNRSVNYAWSVAQFAKELEGGPAIMGGQFADAGGLTFNQMFELQSALNSLGFDAGKPDGFPGLETQAALRAYQVKHQLPADGYANLAMFEHVMQQINPAKPTETSPLKDLNTLEK
jgi:membrane-bound lytic murein transglycosylase B